MKTNKKIVALSLLFLMIIAAAVGCIQPGPGVKKPKIPESISRGEGKEPQLVVYVVEDKKNSKMNLEEYVAGVVAGEMDTDWPINALGAQAILARTYVLQFITEKGRSKYKDAHISTDITEAQAWDATAVNDNVRKALEMTRGKVAVYDGEYIKAWFHAHSGGITARAKEGLAYKEKEPPYTKTVQSPDKDAGPPDDREWKAVFTPDEVRQKIKAKLGRDVGKITHIAVSRKGESGRALTIMVNQVDIPAPELRIALGSTRMKSTLLTNLEITDGKIVMAGRGYGHGVGMSQWGARVMADQGKSPEEIIKYYFNNINIVDLW